MAPVEIIATIFGTLVVLTRFPGIFWPEKFKKWLNVKVTHSFVKTAAIIIVIASLISLYYLFPFITFLEMIDGFFTFTLLIFGLFYFFMPHFVKHTTKFWMKQHNNVVSFLCLVSVIFGISLVYLAYAYY